jgi:phage-related protein
MNTIFQLRMIHHSQYARTSYNYNLIQVHHTHNFRAITFDFIVTPTRFDYHQEDPTELVQEIT